MKKAAAPTYVVLLIVALILIGVFSLIYVDFKRGLDEGSLREIRRQNVRQHANAHIAGLDLSSKLNFPVIRTYIKIDLTLVFPITTLTTTNIGGTIPMYCLVTLL